MFCQEVCVAYEAFIADNEENQDDSATCTIPYYYFEITLTEAAEAKIEAQVQSMLGDKYALHLQFVF